MINEVSDSAKIFAGVDLKNSIIKGHTIIGDFSKVEESCLEEFSRVDRNNYIWKSSLGRHSYTGRNTKIICTDVGNFTSISWDVTIGGANHDYKKITTHSFLYNEIDNLRPEGVEQAYDRFEQPCSIGSDVWIGAGAIILRNLVVNNGAVIAAGAVVTKEVPAYAIVAGVPAKIIGYRFEEKKIQKLLQLQWWNWSDEKIRNNYNFFLEEV